MKKQDTEAEGVRESFREASACLEVNAIKEIQESYFGIQYPERFLLAVGIPDRLYRQGST